MPIAADALLSWDTWATASLTSRRSAPVRDAGYTGDVEVEIFNQEIWDTDGNTVLETVKERYAQLVLPFV
jgi:hypothetical protein